MRCLICDEVENQKCFEDTTLVVVAAAHTRTRNTLWEKRANTRPHRSTLRVRMQPVTRPIRLLLINPPERSYLHVLYIHSTESGSEAATQRLLTDICDSDNSTVLECNACDSKQRVQCISIRLQALLDFK